MKIINLNKFSLNPDDINLFNDMELKIIEFLNSGSYGQVYLCLFNNMKCVIKLSNNEYPELLKKRYKELKQKISNKIIKIYCCGEILDKCEYKYYSVMKYGGYSLKNYISEQNINKIIIDILKQLYEIIKTIKDNKLLIPDMKLSNLTFYNNELRIIDYFIECEKYNPCSKCKIVRTYSVYELSVDKLYTKENYNYSYIYVLFGFCLIEILCKKNLNAIHKTFKHHLKTEFKKFILFIQISSYIHLKLYKIFNDNYLLKLNENLYNYYGDFINLIQVKDEYKHIINDDEFKILLNNILIPVPEERKIEHKLFV